MVGIGAVQPQTGHDEQHSSRQEQGTGNESLGRP